MRACAVGRRDEWEHVQLGGGMSGSMCSWEEGGVRA